MKAFPRFSDDVSAVVGFVLLVIPTYFVAMSALRYDAPGLRFFGNPILVLVTLATVVAVNVGSILSVKLEPARPRVLKVTLSLRVWNLGEIMFALLLLGALSTYLFVENFAPRASAG
jgi:hypothetical protein